MADLPTNYLDDILAQSMNGKRKYRITRADGTFEEVTLEDVSEYEQVGSNFGAGDINKTNQAVNEKFDSGDVVDPMLTTEPGFAADAYQTKLQFDAQNKNLGGLRFGVDGDGNYGYYGADDSLIPFKSKVVSFLSADWTRQTTGSISISTLATDGFVMLIEESISYNDAWATASLTSPYIDITDYKKLVIKYYSKKTTGNNGDKYSPKIYLQNSGGSNVKTIYNHAQTQHASYYSGTIEVDLSSYTGNHRLQLVFSGYGNAVSANAGAMICLSEATLSKK